MMAVVVAAQVQVAQVRLLHRMHHHATHQVARVAQEFIPVVQVDIIQVAEPQPARLELRALSLVVAVAATTIIQEQLKPEAQVAPGRLL
jgi:hypothetical protein